MTVRNRHYRHRFRSRAKNTGSDLISPFRFHVPSVHPSAFVDRSARIIGDVTIESGVTVWPMAVLRADSSSIRIRTGAVVLDLALVEAPDGFPVDIAEGALISHGAIIHGAVIGPSSLVGIGAIVLDGATVSPGSIIGAGSIIPPGTVVPADSLVIGSPGKVVRKTTADERARLELQVSDLYEKSRHYLPSSHRRH